MVETEHLDDSIAFLDFFNAQFLHLVVLGTEQLAYCDKCLLRDIVFEQVEWIFSGSKVL